MLRLSSAGLARWRFRVLAVLTLAGCSDGPTAGRPDPGGPGKTDPLPFRVDSANVVAASSYSSAPAATDRVLTSAADLDSFWVYADPIALRPSLAFDDSLGIAVTLGPRASSGYGIRVDSLTRAGDSILVHVTERERVINCPVLTVITSPFQIVQVPRLAGTFAFRRTVSSITCPP